MLRTMHAASVSAPTSLPPSRSPHGAARGGRGCSGSFCSAGGPPPSLLLPPARSLRRCPRLGRCLSRRWFRLDLPARTLRGGVPPVREVVAASARAARNARSAGGGRIVEVVARRHLLRRPSASLDFLGAVPTRSRSTRKPLRRLCCETGGSATPESRPGSVVGVYRNPSSTQK